MRLFPRLSLAHGQALASQFAGVAPETLRAKPLPRVEGAQFAPTGGSRVTEYEVIQLRTKLDTIADQVGFPEPSLSARQSFDHLVAETLGGEEKFHPGEMLRAEAWAWIGVFLVPHLVQWRFGGPSSTAAGERFAGSMQRNALGRLWLRAWVFDDSTAGGDRWGLMRSLPEDATVAILERTRLAADRRLARALARSWAHRRAIVGGRAEELLRESAKRVRILAVIQELQVLSEPELAARLDRILDAAVESLGGAEGEV